MYIYIILYYSISSHINLYYRILSYFLLFPLEIMERNGFWGTDQFLERNGTLFYGTDHCWNGTERFIPAFAKFEVAFVVRVFSGVLLVCFLPRNMDCDLIDSCNISCLNRGGGHNQAAQGEITLHDPRGEGHNGRTQAQGGLLQVMPVSICHKTQERYFPPKRPPAAAGETSAKLIHVKEN